MPEIPSSAETQPSPDPYARLERGSSSTTTVEQSLNGWRAYAMVVSVALFLVTAAWLHQLSAIAPAMPELYTVLRRTEGPAFVVGFNEKTGILTVFTVAAKAPPGKSYELWLDPKGGGPSKPIAVLGADEWRSVRIKDIDAKTIHEATLSLSVEPAGGSPTGQASRPVLYTGKLAPRP